MIAWKPTIFCNGFLFGIYFRKFLFPSLIDNGNDVRKIYFRFTNRVFNPKGGYLMLCFKNIMFFKFCSVLLSLLFITMMLHKEYRNDNPFVIFITYVLQKLQVKTATVYTNPQHWKNTVFSIILIQFQSI